MKFENLENEDVETNVEYKIEMGSYIFNLDPPQFSTHYIQLVQIKHNGIQLEPRHNILSYDFVRCLVFSTSNSIVIFQMLGQPLGTRKKRQSPNIKAHSVAK